VMSCCTSVERSPDSPSVVSVVPLARCKGPGCGR
jgi:hypothetical protein